MNININGNNKFKNQHLRIADILADDDDDGEYFVRDLRMECWSPRRIVARWLAAVWRRRRRNKERSIVNVVPPTKMEENQPLRTRGSVDGLESRPGSSLSSSESEAFYLLCFLIIEFVIVSFDVSLNKMGFLSKKKKKKKFLCLECLS